jgi:hypothetical protein
VTVAGRALGRSRRWRPRGVPATHVLLINAAAEPGGDP